jgi:hypothetical protein
MDENKRQDPERVKRRIINAITHGAAQRGTFNFMVFKDYLDQINPELVQKYNELMKLVFGAFDDDSSIAYMLAKLAAVESSRYRYDKMFPGKIIQNLRAKSADSRKQFTGSRDGRQIGRDLNILIPYVVQAEKDYIDELEPLAIQIVKDAYPVIDYAGIKVDAKIEVLDRGTGGYEQVDWNENGEVTIVARAICFPMLVHEILKGLYEVLSLQGFGTDKEKNKHIVQHTDKIENEPEDMRYGKFIYDALSNIFNESPYDDSRIREFFFTEIYKLPDNEFKTFINNAISGELTSQQRNWAYGVMKSIETDLKKDDTGLDGLGEVKRVNSVTNEEVLDITKDILEIYRATTMPALGERIVELFSQYGNVSSGNLNMKEVILGMNETDLTDFYVKIIKIKSDLNINESIFKSKSLKELMMGEEQKLYHGTTHKFDCFRTKNIGSGTGAQAYGWGLYFSTSKDVAISYANSVYHSHGEKQDRKVGEKSMEELGFQYDNPVFHELPFNIKTGEEAVDYAHDMIDLLKDFPDEYSEKIQMYQDFIEIVQHNSYVNEPMIYVYEVIAHKGKKPEEYNYLDFGSNITPQQKEKIVSKATADKMDKLAAEVSAFNGSGGEVYSLVQKHIGNPKKASLWLLSAGIDGTKTGDYHIIFDEKAIQIINVCNLDKKY